MVVLWCGRSWKELLFSLLTEDMPALIAHAPLWGVVESRDKAFTAAITTCVLGDFKNWIRRCIIPNLPISRLIVVSSAHSAVRADTDSWSDSLALEKIEVRNWCQGFLGLVTNDAKKIHSKRLSLSSVSASGTNQAWPNKVQATHFWASLREIRGPIL